LSKQIAEELDIERLLTPIAGNERAGIDLKAAGIHEKVKEFRKTDDPEGALGLLREGEGKVANWKKVEQICTEEFEKRGKDLQIAVWLAEARVKQRGLGAVADGLTLVKGLHDRFWDNFYPLMNEEEDIEMRSGRLDDLDILISQCLLDTQLTPASSNEEAHTLGEWKRLKHLGDAAEATSLRGTFEAAVASTNRTFYEKSYAAVLHAVTACEELRSAVESKFRAAPGYKLLDGPPNFLKLRNNLSEIRIFVEDILKKKGGLPGIQAQNGAEGSQEESVQPSGTFSASGNLPLSPVNRADAIRRLIAIADFFQRTEPHSPVSHLVQRAARWGEMPLEKLLDELVRDPAVLSSIRETLGLREPNAE
jgi:type VI secretion system protein ImpA